MAPEQQAETTLREAFPSIDAAVVKAVLRASSGRLEPAFNALLGINPTEALNPTRNADRVQVCPIRMQQSLHPLLSLQDEHRRRSLLQLLKRVSLQLTNGTPASWLSITTVLLPMGALQDLGLELDPNNSVDRLGLQAGVLIHTRRIVNAALSMVRSSHVGILWSLNEIDDLPVIRDNIKKGFLETQSTVNKWVNSLKKKIDGEDEDDFQGRPAQPAQGNAQQRQYSGRTSSEFGRRSADRERYDADPKVLGDDFTGLELRDSEGMFLHIRTFTPEAKCI